MGKADDVGRGGRVVRLVVAVLLADRRRIGRADAQQPLEVVNSRADRALHQWHRYFSSTAIRRDFPVTSCSVCVRFLGLNLVSPKALGLIWLRPSGVVDFKEPFST